MNFPGPLLRHSSPTHSGGPDPSPVFELEITARGFLFLAEQPGFQPLTPIFEKHFELLDEPFKSGEYDFAFKHGMVVLFPCSRIWNDIRVSFTLHDKDAAAFSDAFDRLCPIAERSLRLPTKVYLLESDYKAQLVQRDDAIHEVFTDVLTRLAFSPLAAVLFPVVHWSVEPGLFETNKSTAVIMVHKWLKSQAPPPIVIVLGDRAADAQAILENVQLEDDAGAVPLPIELVRPELPSWDVAEQPEPEVWFQGLDHSYGVHGRGEKATRSGQDPILLSWALINAYLMARAVASCNPGDEEAQLSLKSAEASLQVTLIHELSHAYVTQYDQISPMRTDVRGTADARWDEAEDHDECAGQIEAGRLVETAWFGAPHYLALRNDGAIRFLTIAIAGADNHKGSDSEKDRKREGLDPIAEAIAWDADMLDMLWTMPPNIRFTSIPSPGLLLRPQQERTWNRQDSTQDYGCTDQKGQASVH
ncbi:hypothetical protein MKEN_00350000 [Mycena kentingensis (nom. inval.)]|nr:hypothetical protein MKEN_00350000 [Mycena kentingensis (nom. inval.)]